MSEKISERKKFFPGSLLRVLGKNGISLEGILISWSEQEAWLVSSKTKEEVWIPKPYENLALIKVLESAPRLASKKIEKKDLEQENWADDGFDVMFCDLAEEEEQPKLSLEEEEYQNQADFVSAFEKLKARLQKKGISLQDLTSHYSNPLQDYVTSNFTQPQPTHNSRTKTSRPTMGNYQKMRRVFQK